jgi:hypothetical protein
MTSGREALAQIDVAIAAARKTLAQASDAAASDARAVAELDQRQIEIYLNLAEMRLIHLMTDANSGGSLGGVDRKAEELINAHESAVADLANARDAAHIELERLEAARAQAEAAVAAAVHRHDEAAKATRARLDREPAYRENAEAVDAFNAMAARAEQKLGIAREDRTKKGAAYEADTLFAYLQRRKFATSEYRAFPLFAMLDGWVARLIRYREHRLNYQRLIEIPERIAEHVERLKAEAANAAASLEEIERAALERDGVGELRDVVGKARALVETLDAQIADAEANHKSLVERHADAAAGKAGPLAEARKLLADALSRIAVPDLKVLAAETASPEDDRLIDALVRARRERIEIEEARRAAVSSLDRQGKALSDLEAVRRRFKSARYDSPYSDFSGRDLIAVLVSEFLRGAIGRDDLWRRIERGHQTRRRDWDNDLGGDEWRDTFGLPDNWGGSMGGSWGGGRMGRGGGNWGGGPVIRAPRPPRAPRMPSGMGGGARRGGFRTGGGF